MNRVTRSERYHIIGGVAGGLAEYFNIDPLIPRILFIISLFWNGGGLLVYIILWIILPIDQQELGATHETTGSKPKNPSEKESQENQGTQQSKSYNDSKTKTNIVTGLILIFLGLLFLLDQFLPAFYFEYFWPLALILVGAGLLISGLK